MDEKHGKTRASILRMMGSNPKITVIELAKALRISRTAVDNQIQILKGQGAINRVGGAKGGSWQVKIATR